MASIYILGAGAMGSLWATHLYLAFKNNAEHTVQFLSSRENPPTHINFSLHSPFLLEASVNFDIQLPVINISQQNIATPESPNIILICTKSYHALEACLALQTTLNEHSYLVLFQNGLGSQHQVIDALNDNIPIYAAVSTEGVNRQVNGNLIHAGKGLTKIGPLNDKAKEKINFEKCMSALTHSGLDTKASESIWHALWEKLAVNCAINPFTAILDCPNGEIKDSTLFKESWPLLRVELTEMLNVAGINISIEELETLIFKVIHNTQNNISSMLQDVRTKRKTEIEDINGFAAEYLEDNHLKNGVNKKLYMQVNAM